MVERRTFLRMVAASVAVNTLFRSVHGAAASCYMPGDVVDPEVFFLDSSQKRIRLLQAVMPENKSVILVILGGAYHSSKDKHRGIWCEDTLDEFSNLKAAYNTWKSQGVQFLAVACPPVYSDRYGFRKNVFLEEPDDSPEYASAVGSFIEKTEDLRRKKIIPFETVYYDPRFRFLWNEKEHVASPAYGRVYSWQGKFKWHKDEQRYGTPCIWFMDRSGKVLREPLYGNQYGAEPARILYSYWELEAAIRETLPK